MFAVIMSFIGGITLGYLIKAIEDKCKHEYEIIDKIDIHVMNTNHKQIGNYDKYVLQCKKCGNLKIKNAK